MKIDLISKMETEMCKSNSKSGLQWSTIDFMDTDTVDRR